MREKEEKYMTIEEALNNKDFEKEYEVIIVNNDKPFTFTKDDYKTIEGIPYYTDGIKNRRSGEARAIISKNTLAIFTSKKIDYPSPMGWTKELKEAGFYNKSHIIAYSLSAKKCDQDNIFIGTEYLNKTTMKDVEKDIYNDIKKDNRVYLYKVTPKYKTENSSIPYAVLIEAETIDDGEKKTVCRLCYNVQKGQKVDYYKYEETKYKEPDQQDKDNVKYKHYSINVKTNTFHLYYKECSYLKNIDPKYIQETKAKETDIKAKKKDNKDKKFKLCKKCTSYCKKKG